MTQYPLGTDVVLKGEFFQADNTPFDPGSPVSVHVLKPSGQKDIITAGGSGNVRTSTYTPSAVGLYVYRFIATHVSTDEQAFLVVSRVDG